MKTTDYILGYEHPLDNELTQYSSVEEAEYRSEEWCRVSAFSLKDAKCKYEETFLAWKASN